MSGTDCYGLGRPLTDLVGLGLGLLLLHSGLVLSTGD